jgi:WD40 repeat protein
LGVSAVGLGYVVLTSESKKMVANETPAMQHLNVTPKAQNQNTPNTSKLPVSAKLRLTFTQHKDIVRLASWSPDGKLLASGADDKHAFVWGVDGTVRLDIQHPGGVRSLAWSPGGQRLVTGANNQVTFFNAQTGAILATSAGQHTQAVTSLAWVMRNQMQVVSGGMDKQVVVWDSKTYHAVTTYKQHNASIDMVSCSVNGQTVASSADDGFVRIWDVANGKDMHGYYQDVARPLRGMAFAPDGVQLAVGGDDGIVRIWSALTCKNDGLRCMDMPQRLHVAQTPVRAVAWSPDGRLLAVGGNDGMFSVWSPTQTQQALFSVKQNDIVRSLAWSPDGKQLACASGNNVSIWDLI